MRRLPLFPSAPGFPGVFLCALFALLSSCERERTPEWEGKTVAQELAEPIPVEAPPKEAPAAVDTATESPRFVAYNLKNWLTMERREDDSPSAPRPKPEGERDAAVAIIADARPDMLGVCEIGTPEDLADLQTRLRAAGIDLPYAHHTGGADETRRQGFLSKYPYHSVTEHPELEYTLDGRPMAMGRGILDVVVDSPVGELHFLGVHLKSKREIPEADQEMMRRQEAHLLRSRVDEILTAAPETELVVFGDMNDTRQSPTLRIVRGPRGAPTELNMVWLKDSRGDSWTHFWSYQDVYSRFDYILVSQPLVDDIEWDECRVLDDPDWATASDHRPLLLVFE